MAVKVVYMMRVLIKTVSCMGGLLHGSQIVA
ncbi:MAG: hypothetical protein A4E69_00854 [Syntrophus sp. PtaB.Bin138]|nr:MAG: hypothetical protein A4E69_00854 [Syntrophus sp. PtaB.Bin138]